MIGSKRRECIVFELTVKSSMEPPNAEIPMSTLHFVSFTNPNKPRSLSCYRCSEMLGLIFILGLLESHGHRAKAAAAREVIAQRMIASLGRGNTLQ
ncbi:hypothetical protein CDAR_449361 [Caerostris darwini]|uniref:Uncharacterized protein n=1 Tax=Caerostris darwini TaxID=1538125 RepID=A0AAV4QV31_9ARAC|nr:hypothetical protein CDAR_449361 [Caerostris darwini]